MAGWIDPVLCTVSDVQLKEVQYALFDANVFVTNVRNPRQSVTSDAEDRVPSTRLPPRVIRMSPS